MCAVVLCSGNEVMDDKIMAAKAWVLRQYTFISLKGGKVPWEAASRL
jgi:hypothetical protein